MKNCFVPPTIEDDALSALIDVLERVKFNGGKLNDDKIWYDAPPFNGPNGCLDELKTLKVHKKILHRLQNALEMRIIPVQNACNELTMQSGIQTLPVEILQLILVASHSLTGDKNEQSLSVSHVCRRFRIIALRTPELWTTIFAASPLVATQEFLTRSASAPLRIAIDCQSCPSIDAFLKVVMPHSSRWVDLDITFAHETKAPSIPRNLQLPLLRSLKHAIYEDDVDPTLCEYLRPHLLWPSLRSYVSVNLVTKFGKPCNNLRECCFVWEGVSVDDSDTSVDISMLLDALTAMPNLTDLSLRFDDVSHTNEPPDELVYPSITKFSLRVGRGYNVDALLDCLFESMSLPNVVDLTLEYRRSMSIGVPMLNRLNYPSGPIPFQTVRSLKIVGAGNSSGELHTSLDLCESLLELSMQYAMDPFWTRSDTQIMKRRRPIQTISLRHCDDVTANEVHRLVKQLRAGPNWETFRRLEIIHCKELTEQFFLTIEDEMEGKLVWIT